MKYLITGLGNPGSEYANTRHNAGYMIADALAKEAECCFSPGRYADIASFSLKRHKIILIKPTTYMNLSGKAVRYWLQKETIDLKNLLVIVDDIALPLGKLRLKSSGSDGGHNGLIDISELLNSKDFPRLRIGIGNDFYKGEQAAYVLSNFKDEELPVFNKIIPFAVEAVKSFILSGIERTMNFYNKK